MIEGYCLNFSCRKALFNLPMSWRFQTRLLLLKHTTCDKQPFAHKRLQFMQAMSIKGTVLGTLIHHLNHSARFAYMFEGYRKMRTAWPKLLGGRFFLNCALTTPLFPFMFN